MGAIRAPDWACLGLGYEDHYKGAPGSAHMSADL